MKLGQELFFLQLLPLAGLGSFTATNDLVKGLVNGSGHSVVDINVISNVSGYHLSCQ